jgi:hypothetical protein
MKTIAKVSTHVRATCNFPTEGLSYTDYFKAKISELDIFGYPWGCVKYETLNIREIKCQDCTAGTYQRKGAHLHINSYVSSGIGCEFDGNSNQVLIGGSEQNFGRYMSANPIFRCTSLGSSTTQYWFGGSTLKQKRAV